MNKTNDLRVFFDNYSKCYKVPFISQYFNKNLKWVYDELKNLPISSLLDVSCGTGTFCCQFKEKFPEVDISGIDLSPLMLKSARERSLQINWAHGDVHNLPYTNDSFDVVVNTVSFHHYIRPKVALSEMMRVLKPGGTLILLDSVKDPRGISILPWYWDWKERKECYTKHLYSFEYKELFNSAGFSTVQYKKKYRLWPVVHLLCVAVK